MRNILIITLFLIFKISFVEASNVNEAIKLKRKASSCYLSLPSHYQSSVSKMYLDGNKFLRDGRKYADMGQVSLSNTFIGHSINMFSNMLRIGKQLGSKKC